MSSCVKCETIASNEAWKEAGGKTKRGKPSGRREVTEKYKARKRFSKDPFSEHDVYADLDALPESRQKDRIEQCVAGYRHHKINAFVYHWESKDRRQAKKLAFQDQLSVANEPSPEELEDEARAEAKKMMTEIDSEEARTVDDPVWRLLSYTAPGKDIPFPFVVVLLYDADLN